MPSHNQRSRIANLCPYFLVKLKRMRRKSLRQCNNFEIVGKFEITRDEFWVNQWSWDPACQPLRFTDFCIGFLFKTLLNRNILQILEVMNECMSNNSLKEHLLAVVKKSQEITDGKTEKKRKTSKGKKETQNHTTVEQKPKHTKVKICGTFFFVFHETLFHYYIIS